jgi:hypothetical protein
LLGSSKSQASPTSISNKRRIVTLPISITRDIYYLPSAFGDPISKGMEVVVTGDKTD